MVNGLDLSRREFIQVGVVAPLITGGGQGQVAQQSQPTDEYEFQGAANLAGPADARPSPGSDFFDNKVFYAYRYTATDTGAVSEITQDDSEWTALDTTLTGYETANLPTGRPGGALVFDTNRKIPAWFDSEDWEFPNYVDDVLVEPQTVANTTTRTTVWNPGIGAGSLVKGRIYQIDLAGTFGTANTSSTFTVDLNIGNVTDAAGVGNVGGNVTDAPWSVEVSFTVREHGENGEVQPHTRGLFDDEATSSHHAPISIDTTVVNTLSIDIQWDEADPDNTATLGQAHLKQMG